MSGIAKRPHRKATVLLFLSDQVGHRHHTDRGVVRPKRQPWRCLRLSHDTLPDPKDTTEPTRQSLDRSYRREQKRTPFAETHDSVPSSHTHQVPPRRIRQGTARQGYRRYLDRLGTVSQVRGYRGTIRRRSVIQEYRTASCSRSSDPPHGDGASVRNSCRRSVRV